MWFAGYFSDRYGPKIVALIGVLGMSTTILLSPPMAYFNFYAFVTLRIIFGLFEVYFYQISSSMVNKKIITEFILPYNVVHCIALVSPQ